MKKFLLILLMLFLPLQTVFAVPEIKGDSAVIASADSNQIIYQKNGGEKVSPFGFTKLLTALVAYELCGMDDLVTVSDELSKYRDMIDVSMNLQSGEEITSGDLIKSAVYANMDDACIVLALHCSESMDEFIKLMNEKARLLGADSSKFVNVTGKEHKEQYSTPVDIVKFYRALHNTPELIEPLNKNYLELPGTNLSPKRIYYTRNYTLNANMEGYFYTYSTGGIALQTGDGKYSSIINSTKDNMNIICMVFGSVISQGVNYSLKDNTSLLRDTLINYSTKTIVRRDSILSEVKLKNAKDASYVLLHAKNTLKGLIHDDDEVSGTVTTKFNIPEVISAPVEKNQVLGTVDYYYNGNIIDTVELVSGEDIAVAPFKHAFVSAGWFFSLTPVKIGASLLIAVIAVAYASAGASRKNRRGGKR